MCKNHRTTKCYQLVLHRLAVLSTRLQIPPAQIEKVGGSHFSDHYRNTCARTLNHIPHERDQNTSAHTLECTHSCSVPVRIVPCSVEGNNNLLRKRSQRNGSKRVYNSLMKFHDELVVQGTRSKIDLHVFPPHGTTIYRCNSDRHFLPSVHELPFRLSFSRH